MPLPSLADQAERLISLGVHDLAGLPADALRDAVEGRPDEGVLVTSAAPSSLAPLLRRGDRPGFVVSDMRDVDRFRPTDAAPVPAPRRCGSATLLRVRPWV